MSASRQGYWWENLLHKLPFTTLWCPGGNRHFRWQKVCLCRLNDDGWGVLLYLANNLWVNITGSHPGVALEGRKPNSPPARSFRLKQ